MMPAYDSNEYLKHQASPLVTLADLQTELRNAQIRLGNDTLRVYKVGDGYEVFGNCFCGCGDNWSMSGQPLPLSAAVSFLRSL